MQLQIDLAADFIIMHVVSLLSGPIPFTLQINIAVGN